MHEAVNKGVVNFREKLGSKLVLLHKIWWAKWACKKNDHVL